MSYEIPRDVLALDITDDDLRQTPRPTIVNVVATYDLSNPIINTELLTLRLPGLGYNPQRFAAAKMRLPRAMTLAFCGGRAVCPGSRSVMQARLAALRFTDIQLRAGEYVEYRKFRVQNIVMSVWAPFEIELKEIIDEYSARAEYPDTKFPGLTFRMGSHVVVNIFVTGRCVITGSKSERLSYCSWWWLYTYVLKRHMRGSAAGTTSSSSYRMSTFRRCDTFVDDCERLSTRYTRRNDGPLANSAYSHLLATTPRMTPVHTPATPRTARALPAAAAAAPVSSGVQLYFERMNTHFSGHTVQCAFVRIERAKERSYWYAQLCALERLLVAPTWNPRDIALVLARHASAQCTAPATLLHRDTSTALMRTYCSQLRTAIGEPLLALIHTDIVANADDVTDHHSTPLPPLHGHSITCPFINMALTSDAKARKAWTRERERLEVALAGGVDDPAYSLSAIINQHASAGCCVSTVDDDDDDEMALRATSGSTDDDMALRATSGSTDDDMALRATSGSTDDDMALYATSDSKRGGGGAPVGGCGGGAPIEDTVRVFISQLHTVCCDFDGLAQRIDAIALGDDGAHGSTTSMVVDASCADELALSIDDVQDYEARFRLDQIRASTAAFDADDDQIEFSLAV